MRQILLALAACLGTALLAAAPAAAQEAWAHYRNARYGTMIDYQEFFEPDEPPANGDGQRFSGPEGAFFRIFARPREAHETPRGFIGQLAGDGDHPAMSYKIVANSRVTVSGRRGAMLYYEAYLFSPRDVVHAFQMEYPARFEADYAPSVRRMARSFGGP